MITSEAEVLLELGLSSTATELQIAMVARAQKSAERKIMTYLGYNAEQATHTEILPSSPGIALDSDLFSYDVRGNRAVPFGDGTQRLQLKHLPVRSITSLYEDVGAYGGQYPGAFPSASLLTQGSDFYLDLDESGICRSGMLIRIGAWPRTPRTIKVTYVAGYSRNELDGVPGEPIDASDLKGAVIEQVAFEYTRIVARQQAAASGSLGAIQREKIGDYEVEYDPTSVRRAETFSIQPTVLSALEKYMNLGQWV